MIKINQIKLDILADTALLPGRAAKLLHLSEAQITSWKILRRSIDARDKTNIYFSYTVLLKTSCKNEAQLVKKAKNNNISLAEDISYQVPQLKNHIAGLAREDYFAREENRPVVVGFGPAGMFAALILAKAGMRPIVYERGPSVEERTKAVERLWSEGILDPEANPQFGEGGAGTFSDGKLNTLTKDTAGRSAFVLETFISYGADPVILMDAKPHVGTDRLVDIVRGIRNEIISLGGEIHFNHHFHYRGEKTLVLAIGHSARDTYEELYEAGLRMEAKDFAMGFRVQHPQQQINEALYGAAAQNLEKLRVLGQGAYKVTHTCKSSGRGVYSFCMCPGGYVVNASSEPKRLCVNGMSYHDRAGENANAAIIVSVRKGDYQGDKNPLGGIALQQELEARAFRLTGGRIPVQLYGDFVKDRESEGFGEVKPGFRGQYAFARLNEIFAFTEDSPYQTLNSFNESLIEGMEAFSRQIRGFNRADAILAGIEARTSSPVRIPRNEFMQGSIPGIYPCGEGAGYAGGIMSAAMDGMKVAEAIVKQYNLL